MARYYMAKPTGTLYKVDGEYVYYFHNQAREWRLCHAHFQHEIENHPEYFIKVDNVTVA